MLDQSAALQQARIGYDRNGWYMYPKRLRFSFLERVRQSVDKISKQSRPEVVLENDGRTVRALHGCHRLDDVCRQLARVPVLVRLAKAVIGDEVYIYQFKVNLKQAHGGGAWPWHQDFAFWSVEDGMPRPDAVTIAIFLDDVHNDNGPLRVLPGTHRLGLLDQSATSRAPVLDDWRRDVSADLKYQITPRLASELAMSHGERVLIGPAGTVCAFHPSIVHASSDNKSKDRRCVLLITYNSINNVPTRLTRPEFLVDRDTVALPTTGSDDLVDDSADAP